MVSPEILRFCIFMEPSRWKWASLVNHTLLIHSSSGSIIRWNLMHISIRACLSLSPNFCPVWILYGNSSRSSLRILLTVVGRKPSSWERLVYPSFGFWDTDWCTASILTSVLMVLCRPEFPLFWLSTVPFSLNFLISRRMDLFVGAVVVLKWDIYNLQVLAIDFVSK
jgi:hypothetical protein